MRATDSVRGEDMIGRIAAAIANLLTTSRRAPSRQRDIAEQRPPAPLELPRGKGEAVMIVDGDAALVVLVEQMLVRLGYRPSGFDSSHAALRALYREPAHFDAVLIDETMSDLCATLLASKIRRVRPDLPILLMSCRSDADCQDAGVDALLRKPLLSRDIAAPLAQVLRERRG
jgi:DNA-binding NtrC family response regulator